MMAIAGFTHTQAPLPPPTAPYGSNDNWVLSPVSGFWGGGVTDHIGAFAQVTDNAPGAGVPSDPFWHTWTWDNTDIRYANEASIGLLDIIYGITANNSPSVQDLWNHAGLDLSLCRRDARSTGLQSCLPFIATLTSGSFHQRKVEAGAAAENTGGGGLSSLTRLLTLIGAARRRADQDQITGRPETCRR